MGIFIAELTGTMVLIILGNGVVTNVVLNKTKGNNGGWIVITMGWAMAVFIAVMVSSEGGAHVNPAVTLGFAVIGKLAPGLIITHVAGQLLGAFMGAAIVWLHYKNHFDATNDADAIRACFSTSPAIKGSANSFMAECIATGIFMYAVLCISGGEGKIIGSLQALPVGLLVLGVALSLGGNTGCAINPARDLGPRIAHAFLPIRNKGKSDWHYSWIPIVAPIIGAVLAALAHEYIH